MARPKKSGLNIPTGSKVDNPFIERAREQWKEANAAEEDNRREALEDLRFLDLEQWPSDVKALRAERGRERPTLTIDQISQPYRQLLSNQQQADAAITVVPESGLADEETAEFIQGLIRSIEYESDSKTAYGQAFASAIGGGWGYLRLRSEYEGPDTFDQKLILEGIENPFSVYADPAARQPDRSDIRYALITQDLPWAEYKRLYADSELAQFDETPKVSGAGLIEFAGVGNASPEWFPDGNVRIAEWYRLEHETVTLHEGQDGKAYRDLDEMAAQGIQPTGRQRTAHIPYVTWCKINGLEVLEGETDEKTGKVKQDAGRRIPGTTIPLRPCYGEVLNVNGKRVYRGIVRAARDSQRMYNYWNSAAVEDMALAPKPPIIGAEGQFEGHEDKFEQANTRAFPYLEYKPLTLGGTPVPPPSRPPGPDPARMQGMSMLIQQAKTDLRSTTGWYDATDPNRKASEQSGKAIQARKASQDQAGLPYFENFRLTLVSIGKLLLEWLPVIYDREHRIVRVLAGEDKPEFAMIGPQGFTKGQDGRPQPVSTMTPSDAKVERFDLSKSGTYGIRVILGPSFTTKREEAASTLGTLIANQPQMMGVFGDLWVKNLDIPDAQEIADRVRRTIPPQILGEEGMEDIPPQVVAKMQQADQMIKAMQAQIAEMTQVIETKQIEQQGKAQIASQQLQGDMAMEQLKQENAHTIAKLKADVDILAQHVKLLIAQQSAASEQARTELQSRADGLAQIGTLAGQASESQRIPSSNGSGSRP